MCGSSASVGYGSGGKRVSHRTSSLSVDVVERGSSSSEMPTQIARGSVDPTRSTACGRARPWSSASGRPGRRCGCGPRRRPALRAPTADDSARRGTSSSRGSRTDRARAPCGRAAPRCASRLTRWISVPTAQIDPAGLSLHRLDDVFGRAGVVGRLHDVPRHFRMDDDADAGMLRAHVLDLPHGEARVHRAVPLPQDDARALDRVGLEAAPDLVRIPHDHLVERHAHLVGGVAAEMLIGQEQNLLAALPRPLQRRRRVRRGADDAAVLAAERFDRRGGVDVGDGDDAAPSAAEHLLEIVPAHLELIGRRPCRPSSSRRRGRAGSPADASRAQHVGALGHEVHAAEDDELGVGMLADLPASLKESPV